MSHAKVRKRKTEVFNHEGTKTRRKYKNKEHIFSFVTSQCLRAFVVQFEVLGAFV
jgi:hypothetical protein